MSQIRAVFAPKLFGLSPFELLLPLGLIASAAYAIVTPAPMLPRCAGMNGLGAAVWPKPNGPATPTAGTVTLHASQPAGCFRFVDAAGAPRGQACHPGTACSPTSDPRIRVTTIDALAERDGYYATVGTRCDSVCCDFRGAALSPDGVRLDDGPLQRVWMRANCNVSSWLVPVALLWGLVSLVRLARGTRSASTLAGLIAGFGFPIALLWRFM